MKTDGKFLIEVPDGYEKLGEILRLALHQAAYGKGLVRHANGKPFHQQPICEITRQVGIGFPLGQAMKKIQESRRLDSGASAAELLGAINYLAASMIVEHETAGANQPGEDNP